MAAPSLAGSPQETTIRTERGLALYAEHGHAITYHDGIWYVPSSTKAGVYEVRLEPRESCECGDFEYRGSRCKHIVATTVARAKTSPCSCCGQRVPNRFITEVLEEHGLLSWYAGDLLCADCIAAGFFA